MAEKKSEKMRFLVRVASTDLPGEKQIVYAMTKIDGIGVGFANAVCSLAGVDPQKKAGLMTEAEVKKIEKVILDPSSLPEWMYNRQNDYETGENKHIINADLKFTKDNDIKRLMRIKSRRGFRHSWKLPLRGQRTKSNFRKSKAKASSAAKKGRRPRGE